ncbi:MAG: amidohydrolase family protein [Bdellovibrionota bacterium]
MPGAIDYWCNLFTPGGIQKLFLDQPELRKAFEWLNIFDHLKGYPVEEFTKLMDAAGVEKVFVPAAKMASWEKKVLQWDLSVEEVAEVCQKAPKRIHGLFGINPWNRMEGVRALERAVKDHGFVGAHYHPYGFDVPVSDAALYPFYAKCVELNVPVVMQIGHSAEFMPNEAGRPLLLDRVALYFPELKIIAAHTGWPWVEELLALAWKHPNLYVGTSAHAPKYWDPKLVAFINSRGQDKTLYGSDHPVLLHKESLAQIDGLNLKPAAREKLLYKNAQRVFGF